MEGLGDTSWYNIYTYSIKDQQYFRRKLECRNSILRGKSDAERVFRLENQMQKQYFGWKIGEWKEKVGRGEGGM